MSSKRTMGLAVSRRWRLEMQPCKSPSRGGRVVGFGKPNEDQGQGKISTNLCLYSWIYRPSTTIRLYQGRRIEGDKRQLRLQSYSCPARFVQSGCQAKGGVYSKQVSFQRNDNRIRRCLVRTTVPCLLSTA